MARLASPLHLPLSDQSALRAIVKKGTHKSRTITLSLPKTFSAAAMKLSRSVAQC